MPSEQLSKDQEMNLTVKEEKIKKLIVQITKIKYTVKKGWMLSNDIDLSDL